MKVLIVDDEKLIRWSLSRGLEGAGYAVDTAANGIDALHMIEQFKYDIVVTDLRMPGLDGIELLKRIKESEKGIPVIFLSAYLSKDVINDAGQFGAFRCVSKPFQIESILHIVKEALDFKSHPNAMC